MHEAAQEPFERLVEALRAAAEPTRLRLLSVCARGEWTVSELVQVVGQSQPRVSRHLKVLAEAGLLERFREGSWVFYRRARSGAGARTARNLCRLLPEADQTLKSDARRLAAVREARRKDAERWFNERARDWDAAQDPTGPAARLERELAAALQDLRPKNLLDIGTGTGRVLGLAAGHVGEALGVDVSLEMLRVARVNLDKGEARNCRVRQGDMYQLPVADGAYEAVTLHQVLHFADDPEAALAEAARALAPGGKLFVADLARHGDERLRAEQAHRRLGFDDGEVRGWLVALGLTPDEPVRLEGDGIPARLWTATASDRRHGTVRVLTNDESNTNEERAA